MLKMCSSYSGECPCLKCIELCPGRCGYQEDAKKYEYDVDTEKLCSIAKAYCEGSITNDTW